MGLLQEIAKEYHTPILSNLRKQRDLKWKALGNLYFYADKEHYTLKEWADAVGYLLGCEAHFDSYQQVEDSLKPFSIPIR